MATETLPLTTKEQIMQAVARGWCHEKNSAKTMDSDLAMAITEEVLALHLLFHSEVDSDS